MPLAAVLPLGIIIAALGVTGMGLDGVHRLFAGEVPDSPPSPDPGPQSRRRSTTEVAYRPGSPAARSRTREHHSGAQWSTLAEPEHPLLLPCAQRKKPQIDRWKEAMFDRDRMIKAFYQS